MTGVASLSRGKPRALLFAAILLLSVIIATIAWPTSSSGLSRSAVLNECSLNANAEYSATQVFTRTPVFVSIQGEWAIAVFRQGSSVAVCTIEGAGVAGAGPYVFTAVKPPGVVVTEQDPLNSSFWSVVHVGAGFRHPVAVGTLSGSVVYRVDSFIDLVDVRSSLDPDALDPSFKLVPYTVGYLLSVDRGVVRTEVPIRYCSHATGTLVNHCRWTPRGLFPPGTFR